MLRPATLILSLQVMETETMDKIPMTAEGYSALENELKHCQQVERPRIIQQITDARTFGATVTLIDEDTEKKAVWQLVGEPEADAKKGKISITSPLARALVGKKKGAQVEVVTPGGAKAYEVMKVEWK
jgi:transcription elongation factor GreA